MMDYNRILLVFITLELTCCYKHTATINVGKTVTLNDEAIAFEDLPVLIRERLEDVTTADPALIPITSDASMHKLLDDLFIIFYANNVPKYRYILIIDNELLQCDLIWPTTAEQFWCASDVIEDGDTQINVGETSTDGDELSVTGDTLSESPGGTFPENFEYLLEDHLARTAREEQVLREVKTSNEARSQEMYAVISLVVFFAFMLSLFVINVTTQFIHYFLGTYKYGHYAIIWISLTVLTVIFTFSPKTGIVGLISCLTVMFLIVIVAIIVYNCKAKCAPKHQPDIDLDDGTEAPTEAAVYYDESSNHGTCLRMKVNYFPGNLTSAQKTSAYCHGFWICVCILFGPLTAFSFWTVNDYHVVDRGTSVERTEFMTQDIAKLIALLYGVPGMATTLYMQIFLPAMTKNCGITANIKLEDHEKEVQIYENFIGRYDMNMTQFDPSDYMQYGTVNDFFTRTLAVPRPIAEDWDPLVVSSGADCRVTVFPNVGRDRQVWIKGKHFSARDVVGPDYDSSFDGGSMIMFRLTIADYHHVHSPVAGKIGAPRFIAGTLHSVGADSIASCNNAVENQRKTVMIETDYGKIAYVMIGSTCVGSAVITKENTQLERGEEFGYFQYGGSTLAAFFQKGMVEMDPDLQWRTSRGVETYVRQGQRVASLR